MDAQPSFLETYLPYVLRRADQALSGPLYDVLSRSDVGRSDWRVLAVLEDVGELPVLELAEAALSPQPTVTHAVRRLEARGLVTSKTDAADKRRRFISITPAGSTLTRRLIAEARQLESEALHEVGDLSDLVDQLRELTNRIQPTTTQPTSANAARSTCSSGLTNTATNCARRSRTSRSGVRPT